MSNADRQVLSVIAACNVNSSSSFDMSENHVQLFTI